MSREASQAGPGAFGGPVPLVAWHGRARGTLRFKNEGPSRLERRARIKGLSPLGRDGRAVEEAVVAGAMEPGAEGMLTLSVHVDPSTPAGEYPARVVLGNREVDVLVVVPSRQSVRLTPHRFYVEGGAAPPDLTIVAENRGTVPVTLRNPLPSLLEPMGRMCSITRTTFAKALTKPGNPLESLAAAFLETSAKSLGSDQFIGGTLEGAPMELAPGEQRALKLKLRVPGGLKQERYQGVLELGQGARVRVEVRGSEPNGGST